MMVLDMTQVYTVAQIDDAHPAIEVSEALHPGTFKRYSHAKIEIGLPETAHLPGGRFISGGTLSGADHDFGSDVGTADPLDKVFKRQYADEHPNRIIARLLG